MASNFNTLVAFRKMLADAKLRKDPRVIARTVLGALLLANIIAALILFKPWGGSAEDLASEQASLMNQILSQKRSLESRKDILSKVQKARKEGDRFLDQYILDLRTAYSTVIGDLDQAATSAGVKIKDSQFSVDEIDGSDTLGMMTVAANYEGEYSNLTRFVNQVDRSPRFFIIESIQAAPQASTGVINVTMRLNVFVRGSGEVVQ
jgi:Tfp pilus assembly protein PilO